MYVWFTEVEAIGFRCNDKKFHLITFITDELKMILFKKYLLNADKNLCWIIIDNF